MKNFFRNIHLYLGLACGLVIGIVCFTGSMLVFEKELVQSIYPERYKVTPGTERLPVEKLIHTFNQIHPSLQIAGVKIYGNLSRTVELTYNDGKGKDDRPNSVAFMNPYTGRLVATSSQRNAFFTTIFGLHRWLLVQDGPGKLIVGISTLMFLLILITGIILWWPKNKKMIRQRLTLKWHAGWKRINHDLHIVIGFYTAIFLFVFAFTGLAWSFEWFNDGIYKITNSSKEQPKPPLSVVKEGDLPISFDRAYAVASQQMQGAEFYMINRPHEADGAFTVTIMPRDAIHERATNQLFIDQYSGQKIGQLLFQDKNLGQRVRSTFYPVHVGSIGGLPGRIVAFISCVAGFTFPVTGIILWINRLQKNKKKKRKKALAQ